MAGSLKTFKVTRCRDAFTVRCTTSYLFEEPYCAAAMRLDSEDVIMFENAGRQVYTIYPEDESDAPYIAQTIRNICAECKYNKINEKER